MIKRTLILIALATPAAAQTTTCIRVADQIVSCTTNPYFAQRPAYAPGERPLDDSWQARERRNAGDYDDE